jgi:hypothetical protein
MPVSPLAPFATTPGRSKSTGSGRSSLVPEASPVIASRPQGRAFGVVPMEATGPERFVHR